MKTRWLALLSLILLAGLASAQRDNPASGKSRPSHLPVNPDLAKDSSPEQLLRDRLAGVKSQQEDERFARSIGKLAKTLLKDEQFRKSLAGIKPGDIERLQKQLGKDFNPQRLEAL